MCQITEDPQLQTKSRASKFPKSARLLTSSQYKFHHRHSCRAFGLQISMDFRQGRSSSPKLGITVSRKFGKAHDRNRFKRVVREAFRELYLSLPQDLELNVSPRHKNALLSKQAVLTDLQNFLAKILH
jgi:ribonuclease P protein component